MVNKEEKLKEINKNYEWFKKNKSAILLEHKDKIGYYVIIENCDIRNFYKTYEEAQKNAPISGLYSIQKLDDKNIINMTGFFSLNW